MSNVSNVSNENVLITGGAGFIGSHLAEWLLGKGYNVQIVDDFSTGSLENIKPIMDCKRLKVEPMNILDVGFSALSSRSDSQSAKACASQGKPTARKRRNSSAEILERLVKNADVIYHLAAVVGVKYVMEQPMRAIKTNVHATETVMELASKYMKPVMLASTSEVYGKNGNLPYREDGDRLMGATTSARWSYACTKALDEFMALAYQQEHGLPVVIVRFFNTCGPRQTGKYGMVVPRFVQNALLGLPLQVHGDGTQSRCFTYVGDAIKAVTQLMDTPDAVGSIFNVGSTNEIAIGDLAKRIIEMTGSKSTIEHFSYEEVYGADFEDMKRRVPDITKIHDLIGWEPVVTLDELLEKVIEYERTQ